MTSTIDGFPSSTREPKMPTVLLEAHEREIMTEPRGLDTPVEIDLVTPEDYCSKSSSCFISMVQGYDRMIRWLEYRSYRRRQFQQSQVDKVTRRLTVVLLVFCIGTLCLGWFTQLAPWMYAKLHAKLQLLITGRASSWGLWSQCTDPAVVSFFYTRLNWDVAFGFGILSFFGFIATLHQSSSPYFVTTSLFLSKIGLFLALVILAAEVLLIEPFCWATFPIGKTQQFCDAEHGLLWETAALGVALLQALMGLLCSAYEAAVAVTPSRLYAVLPLQCLIGPTIRVQRFQIIESASDLADALQYAAPIIPDARIIEFIKNELSASPRKKKKTQQASRQEHRFAFVAFKLKTTFQLFFEFAADCCTTHLDAIYLGCVNSSLRPEGLGLWIDRRIHGESLYGRWQDGIPVAPFESFSKHLSSTFSASRLAFVYPSTTDPDSLSFGSAEVEMCQNGLNLKEFPSLLSVHKIENCSTLFEESQQPWLRRQSIDIELATTAPFSDVACRPQVGLLPSPAQQGEVDMLCSENCQGSRQTMIRHQLAKTLSYTSNAYYGESAPSKTKRCIIVICPAYWRFKESLLAVGTMLGLVGSTSDVSMLAILQQGPKSVVMDWMLWSVSPLLWQRRLKRKNYYQKLKPNALLDVLQGLQEIGDYQEVDVVSVGAGSKLLVSTLPLLTAMQFNTISLLFPYFCTSIANSLNLCKKFATQRFTIYTPGHVGTSLSCCSRRKWTLYSAYELRSASWCGTEARSETRSFLGDDDQLVDFNDIDIVDVDGLFISKNLKALPTAATTQIPAVVLWCFGCVYAILVNACRLRRPTSIRSLHSSTIIEDLRSVIFCATPIQKRYPRIRPSTEGVWTFQRT